MTEIIREPTLNDMAERTAGEGTMIPLSKPFREVVKSPKDRFEKKIMKEEQEAMKKGLPFAISALRIETAELIRAWESRWRRRGYADKKDPQPKVDWSRYSDLKNFKVIEEGETFDPNLTNINRVSVFIKWTKYKFEDFLHSYTVMESGDSAVGRVVQKRTT